MDDILSSFLSAGPAVFLPILMFGLALLFGVRAGRAGEASLRIGIGFAGLVLVVGYLITSIQPALDHYRGLQGDGFKALDVGWAAVGIASWSVGFAVPATLVIIAVNLVMLALGWTKVLNVDLWNFIHLLTPGTLLAALTGSNTAGFVLSVALSVVNLWLAQAIAPSWQRFYDAPGTTCSTFSYLSMAWPLGLACNWLVEHTPGLRRIDLSLETLSKRLGFLGDAAFIGLLVGCLLGVITHRPWQTVATMGIGVAAAQVLLPMMAGLMIEGLSVIGDGARRFAEKHLPQHDGESSEILIGMDLALALKDPSAVTATVVLIPLAVGYAFVIPDMRYFPVGLLTGIVYLVPLVSLACRGNLFRTLLTSAVLLLIVEWCASLFVPEATQMLRAANPSLTGDVTDAFFGYNLPDVLISAWHQLMR